MDALHLDCMKLEGFAFPPLLDSAVVVLPSLVSSPNGEPGRSPIITVQLQGSLDQTSGRMEHRDQHSLPDGLVKVD